MQKIGKHLVLFLIGGLIYYVLELVFRGHSHPAMIVVGGLCFLLIGGINEYIPWEMPLWQQSLIGALLVTAVEFVSGVILNVWLGLHIWDYSNMPFNILGQICLPFTLLWLALSLVGIILDDWLRYWFWGEERPHYRII